MNVLNNDLKISQPHYWKNTEPLESKRTHQLTAPPGFSLQHFTTTKHDRQLIK